MDYVPPDYDKVCSSLEAKYAKENLKFTVPFSGGYPVQAYGELKGMRFYFRFRHDSASLHLGIYNQAVEDEDYEKQELFKKERQEKAEQEFAAGQISQQDYDFSLLLEGRETPRTSPNAKDYYPNPKLVSASVSGYTGEAYAGDLDSVQAEDVFSKLVEKILEKSK